MRNTRNLLLTTLITLGLSACASVSPQARAIQYQPVSSATPEQQALNETMYDYLLGQVAGVHSSLAEQRRDEIAAKAYLEVAVPRLSAASERIDDPQLAEYTMKAANYAKKYPEAYNAAKRWTELAPNDARAHQYAAISAMAIEDVDNALVHMGFVIELDASVDQGLQNVSNLLARESNEKQVLPVAKQLVELYPDSAIAPYIQAENLLRFSKSEQALKAVDQALHHDADFTKAKLLKASILQQLKRSAEAANLLAAEIDLHPEDMDLRLAYARFLVSERRYEDARSQYEYLFKKHPNNVDLAYRLGMLSLELNQLDLADKYFMHVLGAGKRVFASLFQLGRIAEQREDYKQALQYYMRVTEGEYRLEALLREAKMMSLLGEPEDGLEAISNMQRENTDPNLDVRFNLFKIDILVDQKNYQAAYDVASVGLNKHDKNFDLLFTRSMLSEQLGLLDESIADLEYLLEQQPENADLLNALGYTLANRTDQYERAQVLIDKAYALKPESAAITDSLAWVYYKRGQFDKAEQYIRKAFSLDPDPEIAAHKGEILWEQGKRQEAEQVWNKALEQAPDHEVLNLTIQKYQK